MPDRGRGLAQPSCGVGVVRSFFQRKSHSALNSLPEIQGRRIDAHIILGKSIKEIAEAEGVHEESVRQSIKRGLERMKKTF